MLSRQPIALRLVATLAFIFTLALPALASRVALVVGNGAYASAPALPNPSNDAVAMGRKLAGIGFEVEVVIDADLKTFEAALDAFARAADGAETALIFYAGHGMQVSGQNYLLPTDIVLRAPSDLATSALVVGDLFEVLDRAAPESAVLILDACRDNPFVSRVGGESGLASGTVSPQKMVFRPNAAGMVIAFAAAPGAVALDGATGNSPYTTALLQWIDRPGIELTEMLRHVRGTVLQLTNGAQVPWVEEALVRDVFLNPGPSSARADEARIEVALLEWIRTIESAIEKDAAETFYDRYLVDASFKGGGAANHDEALIRQGLIWLSIREGADPEAYRAYLEAFPESAFAELAREKLRAAEETSEEAPVLAWLEDLAPVPPRRVLEHTAAGPWGEDGAPTGPEAEKPQTFAADEPEVSWPDTPPPSQSAIEAELGLSENERAAVQLLLAEAGVYGGAFDAEFGPGTRGGIKRVQMAAGLPVTGHLDVETLRRLVARAAPAVLSRDPETARRDDVHSVAAVAARGPGAEVQVVRVEAISRNDAVHAHWRKVADAFEAETPGTQIEINHRPGVRYRSELMSILGANDPPDILYTWSGGHLDALREARFARDLTSEMGEGWAVEFKPGALQTYTHEGRIHGVPMHLSLVSLYANKAVFERAGVPVDQVRTWEGFLEAVETLKAQGIVPVAIGGSDRWPVSLWFGELAQRLAGKEDMEAALSGEGFEGPAFVRAAREFERFAELDPFQPNFRAVDDGSAVEMFAAGEAAMVLTGNWRLQKMRWSWPGGRERMEEELEQLEFPAVGNRPQDTLTYGGADGFAVAADAPDAAVAFLRRLTARDVQERMAEIAADLPSLSGADLSIERGFLGSAADEMLTSTYHQLFLDQALGPKAGDALVKAMLDVAGGQIDGDAAVARVDAAWDEVLSAAE